MLLRRLLHLVAATGLAAATALPLAAQDTSQAPATGRIAIEPAGDGFTISALVTGTEDAAVHAELTIAKRDTSGQVSSTQGRDITLAPGETQTLAQSTLSLGPEGQIDAVLTLSRDGVPFDSVAASVRDGQIETR